MWYDVLIAAILIFFTIRGAAKGVVWQLAGIAGIIFCFAFADGISAALGPSVNLEPPLNHWVVLFIAYLGFSFLSFGVARALHEWIEKAKMNEFNQHLGAVFGLVKGAALAIVLTFLVVTVSEGARVALKGSYSGRATAIVMNRLYPILPGKLHEALEDYIHKLDHPDFDINYADERRSTDEDPGIPLKLGQPAPLKSPPSEQPTSPESDAWSQIRTILNDEARRVVLTALQQTPDERSQEQLQRDLIQLLHTTPENERPSLQQQLIQIGASNLERFLWERTKQNSPPQPATDHGPAPPRPDADTVLAEKRATLTRAIASLYSTIPTVRADIERQIDGLLQGLPERVAVAVLADWKADLYAEHPDPDPGTDMHTPLGQRILRQLEAAGVSLESLNSSLRQRLQSADAESGTNPL